MGSIFTRLLLDTKEFNAKLFGAKKNLKGFAATSKGVFGGLTKFTGYAAAFVGISTSIHDAVVSNMEFEKSLSSLRALTGVTTQELNYFRAEAIRMGMDSTQSATQMVDAFKLIGSQMPELLKNKEALTQTAEAAVTLAEASELDVPTAAKALTGALNQMGASSAHASEYINILAAASMEGAADIPYLNKAIENAGGTASSVGISFSDLTAAIEAIAPRITDAGSAGTDLRNIFLTLESSADRNLRPSVVGLSKSLENLAAKNLDATQLTKMFGKESVTAAIALLQERDSFEHLRTAIVGTNTAYEQADINTNNLAGAVDKLNSAWDSFINSLAGSNGHLKNAVDNLRDMVNWATRAIMTTEEKVKYDTQPEVQQYIKGMDVRIQGGKTPEEAYQESIAELKRYKPGAFNVENARKRKDWASAQAANSNWAGNYVKASKEAIRLYETAVQEKKEYDIISAQLKEHLETLQKEAEVQKKKQEEEKKRRKEAAAAEEAKRKAEEAKAPQGSLAGLDKLIQEKKADLNVEINERERIKLSSELDELVKKRRYMELEIKYRKPMEDLKGLKEMSGIKSDLANMTLLPKDFYKIQFPSLTPNKTEADGLNESLQAVNQTFGMMSGLIQGNADSMGQWALQSAASIAQMILQLQSLATANGIASAMKHPWPASLAAIATVVGTVAQVFASLPKFADGGIVGGSSFFGDKLLARVNSGEMILNQRQQRSLYAMTEAGNTQVNISVDKVRGSDLVLAIRNELKRTGKKL